MAESESVTQCWQILVLNGTVQLVPYLGITLYYTWVNYTQARRKTWSVGAGENQRAGGRESCVCVVRVRYSGFSLLEIERVTLSTSPRVRIFRLFTQTRYQGPVYIRVRDRCVWRQLTHHQPLAFGARGT